MDKICGVELKGSEAIIVLLKKMVLIMSILISSLAK